MVNQVKVSAIATLIALAAVFPALASDELAAKWGMYWSLAGKSVGPSAKGHTISWTWVVPGKEMRQVTLDANGKEKSADRIHLRPDGLVQIFTRERSMFGTVYSGRPRPDGSIIFNNGAFGGFAAALEDEALVYRAAKWSGGTPTILEETERFPAPDGISLARADTGQAPPRDAAPLQETRAATAGHPPADGTALLEIGQEVNGQIAYPVVKFSGGMLVGAYRIQGRKDQRICVRVASDDAYAHATLSTSAGALRTDEATSFVAPWVEDHPGHEPPRSRAPATFLARLSNAREKLLWVSAHLPAAVTLQGAPYQRFRYKENVKGRGSFALLVWDADLPEPLARDERLAAARHPGASDPVWLGDLATILDQPWLDSDTGRISQFSLEGNRLVQRRVDSANGQRLADWVFEPTGRRGQFRLAGTSRLLEVQCDGSWAVRDSQQTGVARIGKDGIEWKMLSQAESPYVTHGAYPRYSSWIEVTDKNVAQVQANLAYQREQARLAAEAAARERAERAELFTAVLGGFASGLQSATQGQQRMEQGFRDARAEGMRQGMEARQAMRAADLAAILRNASPGGTAAASSQRQADVEHARRVREQEQAAREARAAANAPAAMRDTQAGGLPAQPATGGGAAAGPATAASASTRERADACVGQPVTTPHKCGTTTGVKGIVSNQCSAPVDVRICFVGPRGWDCQSRYGLAPQATWEPGLCSAIEDRAFRAVRYSDSNEPLASP